MLELKSNAPASSLGVHDILTALFKHKWKIILCSLIGIGAAAAVYFTAAPAYESDAKVLVQYIVDRSAVDTLENSAGSSAKKTNDSVINSEVEILTSTDLALDVADIIGIDKLLAGTKGPITKPAAAYAIESGLKVTARKGSDIIWIAYQNRDPQLATLVLEKLVAEYFKKHLEIHRIGEEAREFVGKQADEIRGRLSQTEADLKVLMDKANILSLSESTSALTAEIAKNQADLQMVETELAEQNAKVRELERLLGGTGAKPPESEEPAPAKVQSNTAEVQEYQALNIRLAQLRQKEFELLAKYTPENQLVKSSQSEIANLDAQRRDMEKRFPGIAASAPSKNAVHANLPDLVSEGARLVGIAAKAKTLSERLEGVQKKAVGFREIAGQIAVLERKKSVEEANYKYIGNSVEKARIDNALDATKAPNLKIVQKPSTAMLAVSARNKIAGGFAFGGAALGLGLALLIELVMDRSIKRPLELETKLRIPLMLTIPEVGRKGIGRVRRLKAGRTSAVALKNGSRVDSLPWDVGHFIRPFSEAIRDRLVLFFKLHEMTHKPKLIAVTGFSGGEGTSTIAGGLAAVLSEMGDGKVLLVDMNGQEAAVHPFFDGNPVSSISEVLQGGKSAPPAAENLFLATASTPGKGAAQMIPKKFYSMVPHFKASDFDYIVFDMPPLDQSSATLAMAGSMDKVLVVIEAEKSNGDVVKRACAELVASKAHVSGILNKTRSYGPQWLQG